MLTGMVITALIGLRPDWLKTYGDESRISARRCTGSNLNFRNSCHLNPMIPRSCEGVRGLAGFINLSGRKYLAS